VWCHWRFWSSLLEFGFCFDQVAATIVREGGELGGEREDSLVYDGDHVMYILPLFQVGIRIPRALRARSPEPLRPKDTSSPPSLSFKPRFTTEQKA
jgi:hypothetical protein